MVHRSARSFFCTVSFCGRVLSSPSNEKPHKKELHLDPMACVSGKSGERYSQQQYSGTIYFWQGLNTSYSLVLLRTPYTTTAGTPIAHKRLPIPLVPVDEL